MNMDHTSRGSLPRQGALLLSLLFVTLLAAIWLRFHPWLPAALQGDDLHYLLNYLREECATRPSEIFTATCADRFRPLASGFIIAEMATFGPDARSYVWVNSTIMALTALLVFLTAQRLSRGSAVTALAVTLTFILARFALYHFTQALAPVESLTLLFCVFSIYCYARIDDEAGAAYRWAALAIVSALLAAFTHERTVVVALWLIPALLLSPRFRSCSWRKLVALLFACVAVPVFYISFKTLVLDTQFMIGTGGTSLSFDQERVLEHGRQAVMSMFGFNTGEAYLAGANVTPEWSKAYFTAHVFLWSWLLLLAIGLTSTLGAARGRGLARSIDAVRWPVVLAGFMVATLVPALLTIRLEQRWLMIPFVAVMLVPAWAVGSVRHRILRPLTIAIVILLAAAALRVDTLVTRHFDDMYLVRSMNFANAARASAAQMSDDEGDTIAVLASEDICQWTLGHGFFFKLYADRQLTLSCQTTLDPRIDESPEGTHLYGLDPHGAFTDLSEQRDATRREREHTRIDFIESFAAGSINDPSPVSTPSGQGAFVMPWNSTKGMKNTLTLVSGFEYRFDSILVPEEEEPTLAFAISMTYPSPTRARALVNIVDADGKTITFERDLDAPAADAAVLEFVPQSVSLAEFTGRLVSVRFTVQSPYGEPNGHWIAFASPRIVVGD